MSKVSKTLSTSETLRKIRDRNAAQSRKQAKAKSQPAPAKKQPTPIRKPEQPAKVAKRKSAQKSLTSDFESQSTLLALRADALRIDTEINEALSAFGSAVDGVKSKHAMIEDFIDRELWRYTPTPYESETAWKRDKAVKLGSAAMLFNIASGFKELKGETTQKQREQMGPRKRAVATSAAKKAKKKGKKLPPEVIEAAVNPEVSEQELRQKVEDAGLSPDRPATFIMAAEPIISDTSRERFAPLNPDSLLAKSETNTRLVPLRNGGSGAVEGKSGEAEQYDSVIRQAIETYRAIYAEGPDVDDVGDGEILKAICGAWLNSECGRSDLADMTNVKACDHLERMAKL